MIDSGGWIVDTLFTLWAVDVNFGSVFSTNLVSEIFLQLILPYYCLLLHNAQFS